jgi:hypothetical protein
MTKCHIVYLACTAAVVGTGLGAAPASAGHKTHVVHPGQSIQRAVDAAEPGDTVLLAPGIYHESVKVTTPGLTLRGAGRKTVIQPSTKETGGKQTGSKESGAKETGSKESGAKESGSKESGGKQAGSKESGAKETGGKQTGSKETGSKESGAKETGAKESSTNKADDSCAKAGNGICVEGTKDRRLKGVTVTSLTVTGFTKSGVSAVWTDRLTVRNVTAVKNGVWGIAQERSVRGVFRANTARENGDAGLFLANTISAEEGATDTKGTVVTRNRLEGNRIGLTVRRLRNLTVRHNHLTGNCAAVFVVGDENKPKAGALTVSDNRIERNNKSCPKTARLDALQGSGIVLTGVEDTVVTRNEIRDNVGASPLSGGIVLFKSFVGTPSERNRISDNVLSGNSPADLVNADTGKGNTFDGNSCRSSRPTGLC